MPVYNQERGKIREMITISDDNFLISMSAPVGNDFHLFRSLGPQGSEQFLTLGEV